MSSIKNVALVGASGSLGSVILQKLVASGQFNVKVLRRNGSSSTFDAGVNVVDVDFESLESLTEALKGQDALVSSVGTFAILGQTLLADAAIAAGVKRFLPSEFGSNLDFPNTRQLPVFAQKVKVEDYLIEKSKSTDLTYTFVYNAAFLDWGLEADFLLSGSTNYKPLLINGGDTIFSATTLSTVGDAVVGVLTHPDETKNRVVRIEDIKTSQNKLLALFKQAAPEKPWEPTHAKLDDITAKADAGVAQGIINMDTMVPYLMRSLFDPAYGANFNNTDNELLGLKGLTDEQVLEIVKKYVK